MEQSGKTHISVNGCYSIAIITNISYKKQLVGSHVSGSLFSYQLCVILNCLFNLLQLNPDLRCECFVDMFRLWTQTYPKHAI